MPRVLLVLTIALTLAVPVLAQEAVPPRVSGEWLAANLDTPNLRIVDLRGAIADYWTNHIPGAVYMHPETIRLADDGVPGMITPPAALAEMLGAMGIAPDTTVVAYGAGNDFTVTYFLWALAYLGHESFALLDGGFDRWSAEQRPVTQDYPEIAATTYEGEAPSEDERATLDEVAACLNDAQVVLLDVRPRELYLGDAGAWKRRGHIPGALHIHWQDNLTADGAWKSDEELRAMYAELGVVPDRSIITSCGQGQMSSHTWFVLKHVLGFPNVQNYDGSFNEWSNRDELPVVTGASPR